MIRKPDKYLALIFALLGFLQGRATTTYSNKEGMICLSDSIPPTIGNHLFEIGKIFICSLFVVRLLGLASNYVRFKFEFGLCRW